MFRRFLLVAVLCTGCHKGKKDGATCDDVGAAFLALGHRQLEDAEKAGGLDAKTRATVESHVPAMRDSMVRLCKETSWSGDSRRCFVNATDDAAMLSCYQTLTTDQQAKLEEGFAEPRK